MRTAVLDMNTLLESEVNSARAIGLDGSIHAGGRTNLAALDEAISTNYGGYITTTI